MYYYHKNKAQHKLLRYIDMIKKHCLERDRATLKVKGS